jgi:hypothetical protein
LEVRQASFAATIQETAYTPGGTFKGSGIIRLFGGGVITGNVAIVICVVGLTTDPIYFIFEHRGNVFFQLPFGVAFAKEKLPNRFASRQQEDTSAKDDYEKTNKDKGK